MKILINEQQYRILIETISREDILIKPIQTKHEFKQYMGEQVDYKTLQVGLKIKFKLKDGSENLGTIKQIFSDGVEAKLEKPRYDKSGNLISTSLVTMDTLTGVMFKDKWYTKEDFFSSFS